MKQIIPGNDTGFTGKRNRNLPGNETGFEVLLPGNDTDLSMLSIRTDSQNPGPYFLKSTCTTSTTDVVVDGGKKEREENAPEANPESDLELYRNGRDEMNLVEFPLTPVSERFLDGRKTVVFSDSVWDKSRRAWAKRNLSISGSDRYGLPTAKDEDVLLACIQLSSLMEFSDRTVHFSRYELLKLLRWPDEGRYYRRLSTSLRRWKGVTVYSDRAFYDHARESWVNRDFGIFDNLYVYEREASERVRAPASSWFVWNEVLYSSFTAGYLKRLDWDLYCRLSDPVAKRLYRLLDKRFYHTDEVVFDLRDLAFLKVRVSEKYDTAQIKRALANGIRELEKLWELRPLSAEKRYRKKETGKWEVVFERHRPGKKTALKEAAKQEKKSDLAANLMHRGIGPAMAEELVAECPTETVCTMIELYDWYNGRGEERGPGFLVASIRNSAAYRFPKGFESSAQRAQRKQHLNSRKQAVQELSQKREAERHKQEISRLEPFVAFWDKLNEGERHAYEKAAIAIADPTKRAAYLRMKHTGGPLLEAYRRMILLNYFERQKKPR